MEKKNLTSADNLARYFTLGQLMDVEIDDIDKRRFQCRLVGMKEGGYLLVEQPSLTKFGHLKDALFNRQNVIIRTICENTTGDCLGFRSMVQYKIEHPDRLLFLTFPHSMQVHELRAESRILVSVPASITDSKGEKTFKGVLTDLSSGGCRIDLEGFDESPFEVDEQVTVEFKHPVNSEEIKNKATVRSAKKAGNLMSICVSYSN